MCLVRGVIHDIIYPHRPPKYCKECQMYWQRKYIQKKQKLNDKIQGK